MNEATEGKRRQLALFIEREVVAEPAVQGVVAVGSVARGIARPDSDIDAVLFLEPFDLYAVPAEFKWQPESGAYHGIFAKVDKAIQFDFKRLDLTRWSQPDYEWPEPIRAELRAGWPAFDRHGRLQPLLAERTTYDDVVRQSRLDEALVHLDQLLDEAKAERTWDTLGASAAHDRLHAAYDYLVQAIFAYNCRWRTWRSREHSLLLTLPWLPADFAAQNLAVTNALSATPEGYRQRLDVLRRFFAELVETCQHDGLYGTNPIHEAFVRQHEEPGRDWNMEEWVRLHRQRGGQPSS